MALSDDDRTRFFRLSSVILEELTPILQDLLQNEISPSQIYIVVKQKDFKKLKLEQILVINNAKAVGCYKEFDITLLYTILRNYCPNIQPPTKKWGLKTMPDIQTETTVGDDIERIRIIRNSLFGHISTPAVPENEFEEHWSTISDICIRMDAKLPNKQYGKKLEEAKDRTIDLHTEKIFIDTIKKLVEDELSLKEIILRFIEERELTSRENVTIAAKVGQKRKHAEAFSNMCIRALNIAVETINELTSESEIEQIYKSVEDFFKEDKENIENKNLEDMLQRLEEKIIQYAKLQKGNTTKIMLRFFWFNLHLKKMYGASVESSKGSLILTFTFSSKKGYDLYKKDLERGIIGQKILQLVLYPPYLASFDLQAEDLVVFLNGQKLTQDSGDNDESIHSKSPNLEACADHPDQNYMMACQQCQLPVCVQCIESSEHKDHDFNDLGASLRKRLAEVYKNIQQGIRSQNQLWLEKKRLALEVKEIQSRMTAKYHALKQLLEEVFQQNLNDIERFQESQSDIIGKKINDTDQYISLLMKNFKEISESLPAKGLIHLKSCSLKKDLFQPSEIDNLKFDENDTKLSDINDLFGILNIPKIPRSESGIELDKIDDSELVDEVSNVEEVKDMKLAIIEVPPGVSNFEYTGQQQIKLTLATSFSLSRTASHVSPVSSNRAWVSDFYGDLYLSDDIGYKHYQLKTPSGGSGSHTVTKEGELIFINPDKEIMKISKDFEKEDLNIRLPYSMIPSCVYSSHFNADLLIGMRSKISGMGTWLRISETSKEESYPLQYYEDKLLYEYPQYITENNNHDVIVCDSSKEALVVTNFWGDLRFCYKGHPEKLGFEPNGICTDSWAHILVCDLASNSVQVIDKNGHFLFPLLISSYGFERPFCLNLTQDTLWVGIQSYPLMLVYDVQYDDQK